MKMIEVTATYGLIGGNAYDKTLRRKYPHLAAVEANRLIKEEDVSDVVVVQSGATNYHLQKVYSEETGTYKVLRHVQRLTTL